MAHFFRNRPLTRDHVATVQKSYKLLKDWIRNTPENWCGSRSATARLLLLAHLVPTLRRWPGRDWPCPSKAAPGCPPPTPASPACQRTAHGSRLSWRGWSKESLKMTPHRNYFKRCSNNFDSGFIQGWPDLLFTEKIDSITESCQFFGTKTSNFVPMFVKLL